jgi:hypothetical protein
MAISHARALLSNYQGSGLGEGNNAGSALKNWRAAYPAIASPIAIGNKPTYIQSASNIGRCRNALISAISTTLIRR